MAQGSGMSQDGTSCESVMSGSGRDPRQRSGTGGDGWRRTQEPLGFAVRVAADTTTSASAMNSGPTVAADVLRRCPALGDDPPTRCLNEAGQTGTETLPLWTLRYERRRSARAGTSRRNFRIVVALRRGALSRETRMRGVTIICWSAPSSPRSGPLARTFDAARPHVRRRGSRSDAPSPASSGPGSAGG